MKKLTTLLITSLLVFGLTGCEPDVLTHSEEELDVIAQCITDSGAKMYGAIWCRHCTNQKKLFGEAFKHIEYIECDVNTDLEGAQTCVDDGVEKLPTWEFADGTRISGAIPIQELAEKSDCI